MQSVRSKFLVIAAVSFGVVVPTASVRADDAESTPTKPVLIVSLAGVDRVFEDIDFMFETAGRSEISNLMRGAIANVNDLGGLERGKPMGMALYVQDGLIPTPVPVGFVPVSKIEDLLETMEIGPVATRADPDVKNRYEIIGPRRSLFVEMRGDYALIANDTVTFDMKLESPVETADRLAKKYDFAAALYVDNVPRTTREFFLQLLRSSANAELQQRDDEPDARYALRRANGKRTFDLIEMFLTDAKQVAFGWDTSVEDQRAVIDIDLEVAPDTGLAKLLEETTGQQSLFAPALDVKSPLSLTASWMMDEPGRETLTQLFNVAEVELAKILNPDAEPVADAETGRTTPVMDPAATRLIAPLLETVGAGHADVFFQFEPHGTRSMVLLGGVRMRNAESFGDALVPVLQRTGERPEVAEFATSVESHRGIAFHMIRGKESRADEERIYGGPPSLYVGAGQRALWFAVGGDEALPALKSAIDRVVDASPADRSESTPPFRMVINAKSWMNLPPDERAPEGVRAIFEDSFASGADALWVEFRPTENGGRTRITIEEGFLRLMGKGIGAGIDSMEARRQRRRERREAVPEAPRPE